MFTPDFFKGKLKKKKEKYLTQKTTYRAGKKWARIVKVPKLQEHRIQE